MTLDLFDSDVGSFGDPDDDERPMLVVLAGPPGKPPELVEVCTSLDASHDALIGYAKTLDRATKDYPTAVSVLSERRHWSLILPKSARN
jgi:hypothetical protein